LKGSTIGRDSTTGKGGTIKIVAVLALGAALLAASSHGVAILRQYAWNQTRHELNKLNFKKRLVVAWRVIRGRL